MANGENYAEAIAANSRQVGGGHYSKPIQHWDYVVAQGLGYFEGQITKYVSRWRDKNGIEDLRKARHFLDKLIEVEEAKFCRIKAAIMPEQEDAASVAARLKEEHAATEAEPVSFWRRILGKG